MYVFEVSRLADSTLATHASQTNCISRQLIEFSRSYFKTDRVLSFSFRTANINSQGSLEKLIAASVL